MAKHLILPFRIAEPEEGVHLVVSQSGYLQVSSQSLRAVMLQLASKGWGKTLTERELHDLLSDFPHSSHSVTISSLREASILREVDDDFGRYSLIRMVGESCPPIAELGADLHYMTGIPCVSISDPDSVQENELVVLYTPSHQASLILAAQRAVANFQNSSLLVAYLRGRTLVLDGLFVPQAKTPCHFCQTGGAATGRSLIGGHPLTWATVVHAMTAKEPVAGMQYPVMTSDHWFCAAVLRNRIREIVGPNLDPLISRHVLDRWEVSLEGFQVRREIADVLIDCEFCQE